MLGKKNEIILVLILLCFVGINLYGKVDSCKYCRSICVRNFEGSELMLKQDLNIIPQLDSLIFACHFLINKCSLSDYERLKCIDIWLSAELNKGFIYSKFGLSNVSYFHFNKAIALSKKSTNRKILARLHYYYGLKLHTDLKLQEALKCYITSLRYNNFKPSDEITLHSISNMIDVEFRLGAFNITEKLSIINNRLLNFNHDTMGLIVALTRNGLYSQLKGDYVKAFNSFLEAEKHSMKFPNDHYMRGNLMWYFFDYFYEFQDYTIAKYYAYKSYFEFFRDGDLNGKIGSLINIGKCLNKKKLPLALSYFKIAKKLSINSKNNYYIFLCDLLIGEYYSENNKLIKAFKIYSNLQNKSDSVFDYRLKLKLFDNLAKYYYKVRKYELSENYYNYARINAYKNGNYSLYLSSSEGLYNVYNKLNKYKEAIKVRENITRVNDSLSIDNITKTVYKKYNNILSNNQEIIRKNQYNLLISDLNHKSRIYLFSLFCIVLLSSLIATLLGFRRKIASERKINSLKLELKDKEIALISAQINPHFLFNALNSVIEYVSRLGNDETLSYLTKFSRLTRLILDTSRTKYILLSNELEITKLYLEMEKIRFGNFFSYNFIVNSNIDVSDTSIPSLVIQPFVENALIHGIKSKYLISKENSEEYQASIVVTIDKKDSNIICIIEDNGIGIKASNELKQGKNNIKSSLGLRIIKNKLELLSLGGASVQLEDISDKKNSGTRVTIVLPYN